MSQFDENLFGRVAVLAGYITREELEAGLDIQRRQDEPRYIGQILLDNGFLTEEQVERILEIRRQKVRKLVLTREGKSQRDQDFARLAMAENLVTLDQLEDAVLEQHRLRTLSLHFSLAEVFLSRGELEHETVMGLLARQGRRMLCCPICDFHYRIPEFDAERAYSCVKCGTDLESPGFLDDQLADGTLESDTGSFAAESPHWRELPGMGEVAGAR